MGRAISKEDLEKVFEKEKLANARAKQLAKNRKKKEAKISLDEVHIFPFIFPSLLYQGSTVTRDLWTLFSRFKRTK